MALRRLPVYLIGDCSGSMSGSPIQQVSQGFRAVRDELMGDPSSVEVAYVSVITFGDSAQQVVPLTELSLFNPPDVQPGGRTNLGAAIRLLMEKMDTEVVKNKPELKGDWKPMVFLWSDGAPTDTDWPKLAADLKAKNACNLIALAVGEANDASVLKQLTEHVLLMKDMGPDSFKRFFKYVTQSIKQASAKVGAAPAGAGFTLPPPPPGITIVP